MATEQVAALALRPRASTRPWVAVGRQHAEGGAGQVPRRGAQVLLLNNPTRGVDVGAKSEIYRVIRRSPTRHRVLMVTEDLPELLGLSDRIVITRAGRIARSFDSGQRPTEEEVVRWMM
jgi:ABC-type sugar transport system ATPase subunit